LLAEAKERPSLPAILQEDFDIGGDPSPETGVRLDTVSGKVQLTRKVFGVLDAEPLVSVDSEPIPQFQKKGVKKAESSIILNLLKYS
jgi:hypothetical protein